MTKIAGSYRHSQRLSEAESLMAGMPEKLQQSFEQAATALLSLRYEDQGWSAVNSISEENGFSLKSLQDIAEYAELQTTGNPLLKRGLTLRTSNVFGRGLKFELAQVENKSAEIAPRFQNVIDKPVNQQSCFTQEAFARNEREVYNKGNLIMAYNKVTKVFFPIPFREISNSASNPELAQDTWYYQRTYTETELGTGQPKTTPTVKWYPVLERTEMSDLRSITKIGDVPVDFDIVVVDFKVNTAIGNQWGVPDVLPALGYAWAHAEYIRDASKLLKALSTIAWKVTGRSKANTNTASMKMSQSKSAANTAAMTPGSDLVAMPKAGQVDMKDGQAIAGYVASALEVSLIALLSDPGSAQGSYGAAATLDGPSANSARARQALWITFYKRIFRAMGLRDVVINFPKIQEDPAYRIAQTLQIGFAYGAIWQDEFRAAFLEATDVTPLHDNVPTPTVFTTAAQYSVKAQQIADKKAEQDAETAQNATDAANVQGVGKSDGVGASAGNNDLRDAEAQPGNK